MQSVRAKSTEHPSIGPAFRGQVQAVFLKLVALRFIYERQGLYGGARCPRIGRHRRPSVEAYTQRLQLSSMLHHDFARNMGADIQSLF